MKLSELINNMTTEQRTAVDTIFDFVTSAMSIPVNEQRAEMIDDDPRIFISLREASEITHMCVPKLQEFARSRYKGFPAVLEGNRYLVNRRMLYEWADRYTNAE